MTKVRKAVGAYGERVAERYLTAAGLVVLDRNWRCSDGEVDLILRDGPDVVFCEVKTRRGDAYGRPAEAVRPDKVRRLRLLATRWLDESLARSEVRPRNVRFDVVEKARQRADAPRLAEQPAVDADRHHLRAIEPLRVAFGVERQPFG